MKPLSPDSVEELDRLYMQEQIELAGFAAPRLICVTVISLGKDKGERLAVCDLELERPIWVGGHGRQAADLDPFFDGLGPEGCAALETVAIDLGEPFREAITQHAPQAQILHDQFHVMRHLMKALDQVRETEHGRLAADAGTFATGQFYTLLSHQENLDLDGSEAVEKRLEANKPLHGAYLLKESFRQLWDYRAESDALAFFQRWIEGAEALALAPFKAFAEQVDAHWEGIVAAGGETPPIRRGLVEQLSFRVQTIARKAGDADDEQLRLKILSDFLPALAEKPGAELQDYDEEIVETSYTALQPWFKLLCQMLPNLNRGLVLEAGDVPGFALCWPPGTHPADELKSLAAEVVQGQAPLVRGQLFAHPLRHEGRLFAVLALELDVGPEQQTVVQQLLEWGEQWLRLLLDPDIAAEGSAGQGIDAAAVPGLEQVLSSDSLQAAILAIVNRLADDYGCERVSLGLVQGKRVRVQGLSHGTEFDRRTALVRGLEEAMNAVRDPAQIAAWPVSGDETTAAGEALGALAEDERALCAIPLTATGGVIGAVLCERSGDDPFQDDEQEALLAMARLVGPVLELKQSQSRSLRYRLNRLLENSVDRVVKPGHRVFKLGFASVLALIAVLVFGQGSYRVSADAAIEGLIQRAVVAPFDGFIAEADVRAGDTVALGDPVARLDDRELLLELRKSVSEEEKLENEYRKALASLDRSEGRIAQARLAQVQAQSRLLQQKLDRVQLSAPLAGIIIAGDLSRSLDAPVERGQVLFEVAPLDEYRLVLNIEEQDIAYVALGQRGSLTLTALPHERWEFVIEQVSPVYEERDGRVIFRTEARVEGDVGALRPGMEGVAKIDTGNRSFGWILFHKLGDWLRLQLWLWLP